MSKHPLLKEEPKHLRALSARIRNAAQTRNTTEIRLTSVICNTVIGQMVPDGVVKGGTAMKLRIGEAGSRFTPDFDASRRSGLSLEAYQELLEENLENGWGGFTGRLIEQEPSEPSEVPEDYVMRPFDIKLSYMGKPIKTMRFELGRDEIGSTEESVDVIASDIVDLFRELGLSEPSPVPLLATEYQIAQKLHACTTPNRRERNERAHDLVDLQLLVEFDPPNFVKLDNVGGRLFNARRVGAWPPKVVYWDGWETIYDSAAEGLDVLETVQSAIEWTNNLIEEMLAVSRPRDAEQKDKE